jgi:hypothetical protein
MPGKKVKPNFPSGLKQKRSMAPYRGYYDLEEGFYGSERKLQSGIY